MFVYETFIVPSDAYDIRVGCDMMTIGLLYKTPCNSVHGSCGEGFNGHIQGFGSVGQSILAMLGPPRFYKMVRLGKFILMSYPKDKIPSLTIKCLQRNGLLP